MAPALRDIRVNFEDAHPTMDKYLIYRILGGRIEPGAPLAFIDGAAPSGRMTPPRLSLVIPAYNEAGRIGGTVDARLFVSRSAAVSMGAARDHRRRIRWPPPTKRGPRPPDGRM